MLHVFSPELKPLPGHCPVHVPPMNALKGGKSPSDCDSEGDSKGGKLDDLVF